MSYRHHAHDFSTPGDDDAVASGERHKDNALSMVAIRTHDEFSPLDLRADDRVFLLTGAGISKESGIPTFRDADGLWEGHRVEEVATPQAWHNDPELVWQFYSERRKAAASCKANPGHFALAAAESRVGEMSICTQNIDRLHEQAGSRTVSHVHGELYRSRCSDPRCDQPSFIDEGVYASLDEVPRCRCGAHIRPDIVWFGEEPKGLHDIDIRLGRSTLFIAIGTSGVVFPVAGFVKFMCHRRPDVRRIYVGPEAPDNGEFFDEIRLGPSGVALPRMFGA
jgi:NAD-dependent deacetylase